jgi:tetratricopeptide (TPR) repeat protein
MNPETPEFQQEEYQPHPLLDMLMHPYRSMQALFEYISAWLFTRQFNSLLWLLVPALIVIPLCILILYGLYLRMGTLTNRYALLVDNELRQCDTGLREEAGLLQEQEISPYGELLLRRFVQIQNSDSRSRYFVATQFGRRGRVGQARQMMRSIAPKAGRGVPQAHAWLAVDTITRGAVRDQSEKLDLINDLKNAVTWSGTGPALYGVLADLLESEGRAAEAVEILGNADRSDPGLLVRMTAMALRNNYKTEAQQAAETAHKLLKQRIAAHTVNELDILLLAQLWLVENQIDNALRVILDGQKRFPASKSLARLLSESYRLKYMKTVRNTKAGLECDVNLLDAALKADSSNPSVIEEVAKLLAVGGSASPTLTEALEQQLAQGQATTVTHLMVSNRLLSQGDLAAAIPHLEVALRQAPDSTIVLNNLALSLARLSASNLPRAQTLIERAVKLAPSNAELLDSQGEIRMLANDFVGAVQSLESAVGLDGKRINTRQRLMQAYLKAGMNDMAEVQKRLIQKAQP